MSIKGIIYDFDGTIVSTESLHAQAWIEAGKELGIMVTSEMILTQKGIPDEEGAALMVPSAQHALIPRFISRKKQRILELLDRAEFNAGFLEMWELLRRQNVPVWICTSSHHDFMEKVFAVFPVISPLRLKTVWRERYQHPKPSAEPLRVTLQKMGLAPSESLFVGDAYGDYLTAVAAGVPFVYFCEGVNDQRIPAMVPRIRDHRELRGIISLAETD